MEGRFQQCNPVYCALVGYSQEALRHMHKAEIIHPDDRAANLREIQRLKEGAIRSFEIENRYLGKDGRVVWVRKYVSSLPKTTGKGPHLVILVTDITERKRAEEELRRSETELRLRKEQLQDLTTKLFSAQDEERRRIARELHDDFSQRVAALVLEIGTLEKLLPVRVGMIPRALEEVRIQLEQLTDDLHGLAYKLHPSLLNDAGLQAAIEDHIHKISQHTGLRFDLKIKDVPDEIPPEISMCLFRVMQESIHNIVKHANATDVRIKLSGTSKGIGLSVTDNGTGFDATDKLSHQKGLGLVSMEERVRYLNGFLRIHSRPADGTKVCAWIPFSAGGS
jgi:PAS domain S-box-containing protein